MENNLVLDILKKEQAERESRRASQKWGVANRNKLVKIIEHDGGEVSDQLWDLLLFNIA